MKQLFFIFAATLISFPVMAQSELPYYADPDPDRTVMNDKAEDKAFSITPSIDLLNFPHPLEGAVELVFSKAFSIKYKKSLQPDFKIDGSSAEMDNQSIGFRSYPGQEAFFFGVAYGKHSVDANRYEEINGFGTNIYARAESEYVLPSIGWKHVYDSGFTIGLEFGWIIPFNGSSRVTSDQDLNPIVAGSSQFQNNRDDAEDLARKYADKGLPSVGLLEIGWTF